MFGGEVLPDFELCKLTRLECLHIELGAFDSHIFKLSRLQKLHTLVCGEETVTSWLISIFVISFLILVPFFLKDPTFMVPIAKLTSLTSLFLPGGTGLEFEENTFAHLSALKFLTLNVTVKKAMQIDLFPFLLHHTLFAGSHWRSLPDKVNKACRIEDLFC